MSDEVERVYRDVDPYFKPEAMSGFDWLDLMEALVPEIGWFVVRFNALEAYVGWMMQEYIVADRGTFYERAWVVTHQMSYNQKVCTLMKMLWEYERFDATDTTKKEMKALKDRLRRAGRLRNIVVHANYDESTQEGFLMTRVRVSRDNGAEFEYAKMEPDSVREAAEEIVELTNDLQELADMLFEPESRDY